MFNPAYDYYSLTNCGSAGGAYDRVRVPVGGAAPGDSGRVCPVPTWADTARGTACSRTLNAREASVDTVAS